MKSYLQANFTEEQQAGIKAELPWLEPRVLDRLLEGVNTHPKTHYLLIKTKAPVLFRFYDSVPNPNRVLPPGFIDKLYDEIAHRANVSQGISGTGDPLGLWQMSQYTYLENVVDFYDALTKLVTSSPNRYNDVKARGWQFEPHLVAETLQTFMARHPNPQSLDEVKASRIFYIITDRDHNARSVTYNWGYVPVDLYTKTENPTPQQVGVSAEDAPFKELSDEPLSDDEIPAIFRDNYND